MSRKIHYACMMQDNLWQAKDTIAEILPHVDSITIVDGGSRDDSIFYFRNWSQDEPKIRFFVNKWTDDFPAQRNFYLKKVAEIAQDGDWLLTGDPDEPFSQDVLTNLHVLAGMAEKKGANMVGFQCRAISMKGPKLVHESLDNYWKHLYVKWNPSFHYTGDFCHEGKAGIPHNILNLNDPYVYYHVKQQDVNWPRGVRNAWIGGSGDNYREACPLWVRLRKLVKDKTGIEMWHDFYNYLVAGNLDPEIKQFFLDMAFEGTPQAGPNNWKSKDIPGSSEWREHYKLFFRLLHPEQEPDHMRGVHIP